jgi:hypothetical protein
MSQPQPLEELDLAIPDMDNPTAEERVAELLRDLPGVQFVRLIERGAFIRYNPVGIKHEQICTTLQNAGFRASTFQDSESGKTGRSSQ